MAQVPPPSSLLRISHGLDFVLLSDDEVLVQFGTRSHPSELLRDADMTGLLAKVVGRLLQGPATLAELLHAAGEPREKDATAFIHNLLDRGFLNHADQHPLEQHLRYAFDGVSGLSARSVALFGCGPLGARIAEGLRQHGIGTILLSDEREPDEIWRQFTPSHWDGGEQPKTAAQALEGALGRYGDTVARLSADGGEAASVDDGISKTDLTILATEQTDLRLAHLVNRFALRRRKPWLHAAIDGSFGVIGPLFEPPYTACYNDFRTLATAATPSTDMMNRYRRHILERGASSFFPGLPAYVDIVAGYSVLSAVHRLLGRQSFASGRVMLVNFEQMQIDVEDVLRLPRCPVCGEERPLARPVVPSKAAGAG